MVRKIAAMVSLTIVIVSLGIAWHLINTRAQAEIFLRKFIALRTGTSADEAHALYERYRLSYAGVSSNCTSQDCQYHFGFSNRALRLLPGIPARVLGASIFIKNGKITAKRLMFADGQSASLIISKYDCYACGAAPEAYRVAANGWKWSVDLTPATNPHDRDIAYQVNVSLLGSLRRLSDGRELNPALWDSEYRRLRIGQR